MPNATVRPVMDEPDSIDGFGSYMKGAAVDSLTPLTYGVIAFGHRKPKVHRTAWLAPTAIVIGDAEICDSASIWYGAVVRADQEHIVIGIGTNVQDNCVVHADPGIPTIIGPSVTVGHNATIHGTMIGEGVLIGIGSILLNGCKIGAGSIIAAGSVLPEGTVVPPGSVVRGIPGRVFRGVTVEEALRILDDARDYQLNARLHQQTLLNDAVLLDGSATG